jgi:hypothetical protein
MPDNDQRPIQFSAGRKAVAVFSSSETAVAEIQSQLNLSPYKAIILVFGSTSNFEEKVKPRIAHLCRRGIASAAAESDAVILDGGINAGVAVLMGEGVASRSTKVSLIGVAPKGRVTFPGLENAPADATPLEPNHSHFVLVEGNEWGSQTPILFGLTDTLMQSPGRQEPTGLNGTEAPSARDPLGRRRKKAGTVQPAKQKKVPAVAILIGGEDKNKNEVVLAVRRKLPLIVVKGSGGLADDIVEKSTLYKQNKQSKDLPEDPDLAEIVADGEIHSYALDDLVEGMSRLISRELATDRVLQQAWQTFATYDLNAGKQQKWFQKIQLWILTIGVIGTLLAILDQIVKTQLVITDATFRTTSVYRLSVWIQPFLKYILIAIPVLLTALVAASNRFKQGNKWMLLRAAAEAIKREIYKYRVKGYYEELNPAQAPTPAPEQAVKPEEKLTPEQELAHKVEEISMKLMRTEVNTTALEQYIGDSYPPPYTKKRKNAKEETMIDDGFSLLTADRYVDVRLDQQIKFFQHSTPKLQGQFFWLSCGILAVGAIGTVLSAIGVPVWIALTTAVAGAFTTYLGYTQTENTLTKYNQAATDLENVKGWWNALSASEQSRTTNIRLLVDHAEDVLQRELDGWVQQMQDALTNLRRDQEKVFDKKPEETKDQKDENVQGAQDRNAPAVNVPPPPQNRAGNNPPPGGVEGGAAGNNPSPVDTAAPEGKAQAKANVTNTTAEASNQTNGASSETGDTEPPTADDTAGEGGTEGGDGTSAEDSDKATGDEGNTDSDDPENKGKKE